MSFFMPFSFVCDPALFARCSLTAWRTGVLHQQCWYLVLSSLSGKLRELLLTRTIARFGTMRGRGGSSTHDKFGAIFMRKMHVPSALSFSLLMHPQCGLVIECKYIQGELY